MQVFSETKEIIQLATLNEIAEEANVSVTVVSRVLSDNPTLHKRVAAKTRELVLKVAHRLDYRPNRTAEFLKRGRNPVIGVFLPSPRSDSLWANLMKGIAEEAEKQNFPLSFYFNVERRSYLDFIKKSSESKNCGIISYPYLGRTTHPEHHEDIHDNNELKQILSSYRNSGGKVVMIESAGSQWKLPEYTSISIDNTYGGNLAAQTLIDQRISSVITVNYTFIKERTDSFISTMKDHGISMKIFDYYFDTADRIVKYVTRKCSTKASDEKIGIFAPTDKLAIEISCGLINNHIIPGKDVLLIGYDNIYASELVKPQLTTIEQPFENIGVNAVKTLISLIYGRKVNSMLLKPKLIKRDTA